MKQKKQNTSEEDPHGKVSTERKQRILRDADKATPNGLSSLGVLLQWMCVPGNYEGWHKGNKGRVEAVQSVLAALKKHGIPHRSARAVHLKISKIAAQYLAASNMLLEEGFPSDYLDQEDIDERVERRELKCCPYYRLVSPVLTNFSFRTPKNSATCEDSDDSDYVENEARIPVTGSKRKATSSVHYPNKRRDSPRLNIEEHVSNFAEVEQTSEEQDSSTNHEVVECLNLVAVPSRGDENEGRELNVPLPEFRRKAEEYKLQYVQQSTQRLLISEREQQECELKIVQYRVEAEKQRVEMEREQQKCELEIQQERVEKERRHSKLFWTVDTMLSRQALKDRRVAKTEIDQVLPLPLPEP